MSYVFGDDEYALERSEDFTDLLNLARSDVGEGSEDNLFVGSE